MNVTLIGMGSGQPENLTLQGLAALRQADLILGARRLLAVLPAGCTENRAAAEFVRWILHDGRTKQKWAKMERIGEKYPEKYVLIRNQRELDGFLKEL